MPSVSPRADLESLPKYVPGRTIEGAIKLASNEVPGGALPSVAQAIAEAAAGVNRYPDTGSQALRERLARELDVPVERVAIGCGSVSLCQQTIQAVCAPGDEVIFGWRSFEAYPIVTQVANAVSVKVPITEGQELDLDAMLAAITDRTRVVFVCNPNNPTGTAVRRTELERFMAAVPEHVLIVLPSDRQAVHARAALGRSLEPGRDRSAHRDLQVALPARELGFRVLRVEQPFERPGGLLLLSRRRSTE